MGYKIGIDFGTTNSTVSYVDETKGLVAFKFPGPEGHEYIPSCIAYLEDGEVCVGRAALDYAGDDSVTFCSDLKMVLPLSESERENYAWALEKQPEMVAKDFFSHILSVKDPDEDASSFASQIGTIDSVVFSVPHVWAHAMEHSGYSRLQSIISDKLGLRLIQLVSEPVAAAGYYAYQHQLDESMRFEGNLLVCDMGGGTFDITLCRVSLGKVEELLNDGNGRGDLGKAGVRFDQKLILNGLRKQDLESSTNSNKFRDFYNRLQDYKANNHNRINKSIKNALNDSDLRGNTVLKAGLLSFNFEEVEDAFKEVKQGITEVIARIKNRIDEKNYTIDAIFFVGGFSLFSLVRQTIKDILEIQDDDNRIVQDVNREFSRYAISYGAALIANGLISVEEKYEHTIGIQGYLREKGADGQYVQKNVNLPILVGGQKVSEYENVHFAPSPVRAYTDSPDIIIFVDPDSKGFPIQKKLSPELGIKLPGAHLPTNMWRVGMRVNRSKVVYLVFEDKEKQLIEYELGDLLRQMFGGVEIVDREAI